MTERVTIVSIGAVDEAVALRAMIETMQMEVRLLRVAVKADVTAALTRAAEDDVVILSARGGANGFKLGHGSEEPWIPAKAAFEGVSFRDEAVLISTASAARESGLVDAMFHAGGHLIAPNGDPDDRIIVPWIGACLLRADAGLAEAVIGANSLVDLENRFSYG